LETVFEGIVRGGSVVVEKFQPFDIAPQGIHLVEASAGTGKTYNIASIYVRLIIREEFKVNQILVVTYTEAATKELSDRLMKRLRLSLLTLKQGSPAEENHSFLEDLLNRVENKDRAVELLEDALHNFDDAAIYTIHGFCYHALQEKAFKSGFLYDAEITGDDSEVILDVMDDYWRTFVSRAEMDPGNRIMLKYMQDKGYGPEALASELGPYIGKPYLEVIPRDIDISECKDDLEYLDELYAKMKATWTDDREQVIQLLKSEHLNKNKYPENSIDYWPALLDEWFSSDVPPIKLFEKFEKFTRSEISDSIKKSAGNQASELPTHTFFGTCEQYISLAEKLSVIDSILKKEMLTFLRNQIETRKENLEILSYDDLLLKLYSALTDPGRGKRMITALREAYPVALVDEFQDTDPIQYRIFRAIYAENGKKSDTALFMIGDPKQSIYSFRGADVFTYLSARSDADASQIHHLSHNYRSVPDLIEAVNSFFDFAGLPFLLDDIEFEPVNAGRNVDRYRFMKEDNENISPFRIRYIDLPDGKTINKGRAVEIAARSTASEVADLIKRGNSGNITIGNSNLKSKDIAILVRTHYQAGVMDEALREKGIKSVQYSQESVFNSREADDLQRVLQAVSEPGNESNVRAALATDLMGYTANEIQAFEENEQAWTELLERFLNWHREWQEKGFASMFRNMLSDGNIPQKLISMEQGERRLTNLLHLGELVQEQEMEKREGARSLIKWLGRKRSEETVQADEEQLRLESDEELVKIVTMHRSKGLEYPVVFCPFLWHAPEYADKGRPVVFHDPDKPDEVFIDLKGKGSHDRNYHRWLAAKEDLAESLRLAYVTMTRAKQQCTITLIPASKADISALGYLLLGPECVVPQLKSMFLEEVKSETVSPGDYKEALSNLSETSGKCIQISSIEIDHIEDIQPHVDSREKVNLVCRKFKRKQPIRTTERISSFSSLTRWEEEEVEIPDYDQMFVKEEIGPVRPPEEKSIFTFPRGPRAGNCIHNIFEETNFSDRSGLDSIILTYLDAFNFDTGWLETVRSMVETVVRKPLKMPALKLETVSPGEKLTEMEFYYTINRVNSGNLMSIIRPKEEAGLGNLETDPGFMKGYIDLIFKNRGKYYLLDYKTNYLGPTTDDYAVPYMENEIRDAQYDLQYHIYTVALHRYLKKRLSGYKYNDHFGGVFYLFVRGMVDERGNQNGIFFDRPDFNTINDLNRYLAEG